MTLLICRPAPGLVHLIKALFRLLVLARIRIEHNKEKGQPMLSDEEKWFFDLHGYLVLKQAVAGEDVRHMVELCDRWHAMDDSELPAPLASYRDANSKPTTPRSINQVEYVEQVFADLILNREIMRVVLALTDNCPQHVGTALTANTKDSDDLAFHGGLSGGIHNPANDYQAADGRIFATFLNAGVSLVDVPPGTGFVCIPGSHKSYFPRPDHIDIYDGSPTVDNVSVKAGDVVLFTEALCHGARKWTEDQPRQSVFVRYTTSYASWSPGSAPLEAYRHRISEELYELKQVASFRHRKKVVERLLQDLA
jgi:ectoine hydroxylase-related dioxygenase (phytanoyl-CoA dioxygenase family)